MAQAICELLWIKFVINIAHKVQYDRMKQIEVNKHLIKGKLDSCLICMAFISTHNQIVDVLT